MLFFFLGTSLGKALPEAKAAPEVHGVTPSQLSCSCWKPQIPSGIPGKPREPELIPPLQPGVPSPTASSPAQHWDISSGYGIVLLSIFLNNCTAETPQVPQTERIFLLGWNRLFFFFFPPKKLQKTHFFSSQPPNIFALFPARCAREPQPC